jgi:hypothetical protein
MAMALKRAFLPKSEELELLNELSAPVTIRKPVSTIGGPRAVRLDGANGLAVVAATAYENVVFKFECFYLTINRGDPSGFTIAMNHISPWDEVRCIFQTEWERPARKGEVPASWDQRIRERGHRSMIHSDALAIGISFIGVAFWDSTQSESKALLVCDNDIDPGAIELIVDEQKISSVLDHTEIVALGEFVNWNEKLQAWINQNDSTS